MSPSHFRIIVRSLIKALISVALIAFALRGVDTAAVGAQLASVDPWSAAIAIVLTTGISAIHAERWRIVLARLGCVERFRSAWRLVLIGYFFNQTLPSTVGGDAFRIWGAYRSGIGVSTAASSVIIDRMLALASLLLMILVGLRWLFELITVASARWIVLLVIVGGALGMALLLFASRFATKLEGWRVTRFLLLLAAGVRAVFASTRAIAAVVMLTLCGYVIASYVVYVLARGIAIDLSLGNALLLIPLVTLVTVLPISIAGWGLRESAMVVALGMIGVSASAAFSLSLLQGLVAMASGVPGGLLWLSMRGMAPRAASSGTASPSHE